MRLVLRCWNLGTLSALFYLLKLLLRHRKRIKPRKLPCYKALLLWVLRQFVRQRGLPVFRDEKLVEDAFDALFELVEFAGGGGGARGAPHRRRIHARLGPRRLLRSSNLLLDPRQKAHLRRQRHRVHLHGPAQCVYCGGAGDGIARVCGCLGGEISQFFLFSEEVGWAPSGATLASLCPKFIHNCNRVPFGLLIGRYNFLRQMRREESDPLVFEKFSDAFRISIKEELSFLQVPRTLSLQVFLLAIVLTKSRICLHKQRIFGVADNY